MRNKTVFSSALFLALSFFLISPVFSQTESITITTYYPAPFGVYQNMRLFPTTTVPACDADNEGVMYYDNTNNYLMVCRQTASSPDTFGWQMANSLWTFAPGTAPNPSSIYPNDKDWNVGIGTTTPIAMLNVVGEQVPITPSTLTDGGIIRLNTPNNSRAIQMRIGDAVDLESIDVPLYINLGSCWKTGVFNASDCQNVIMVPTTGAGTNPAKVGIGTMNPQTKLDVAGEVRIGKSNPELACSADTAGAIRYNTGVTPARMEYCDGAQWRRVYSQLTVAPSVEVSANRGQSVSADLGTHDYCALSFANYYVTGAQEARAACNIFKDASGHWVLGASYNEWPDNGDIAGAGDQTHCIAQCFDLQ